MNAPAKIDTSANTSFSRQLPGLQLAIDSTSLGAFKTCPRYYQLSIVEGWQPRAQSVHLTFGLHLHKARETYDKQRAQGVGHDDALDTAFDEALRATWDSKRGRPWVSDHPQKNRMSLLRTIVWYLDKFGKDDPLETLKLANGKPAVELSFRFDAQLKSISTGESFVLCGHLDRIAALEGDPYIVDIKTTGSILSPSWFKSFSPGNQFSLYTVGSLVAFAFPVKGLIVDGIQVGATFARMQRGIVPRPAPVVEEWLRGAEWWIKLMEACARVGEWPQNDKSCGNYGGCQYQGVCSLAPSQRPAWLAREFTKRVWDPLVVRGDV